MIFNVPNLIQVIISFKDLKWQLNLARLTQIKIFGKKHIRKIGESQYKLFLSKPNP